MRRTLIAAVLSGGIALSAHDAHAQEGVPSLDLRGLEVPTDPASLLSLEPASTPGPWNFNVGAWASYAASPVVLTDASGTELRAVEHQASIDYLVNVGLGERFALGLVLPTVVYQSGDDVTGIVPGAEELPTTALGDLSLTGKATLLSPSDLGGFGLALLGRASAPTGGPTSYVSEEGFRGGGSLLGELSLLAIAIRGRVGARLRSSPRRLVDDGTDATQFGHDLPWGASLTFRPQIVGIDPGGRWRWNVEAHGAVALTPEAFRGSQSPAQMALSARYTVDELSFIGGVEIPLNDAVGIPLVRPVLGIGWAPRFEDEDGDGVEDGDDECLGLEEDRDGFEDADGCPDWDNDDDGVGDDEDQCPGELEDEDGFADDDGCPDPDNDADGLADGEDPCPDQAGQPGALRKGCPVGDADEDGVPDDRDECVEQAEDADDFQDGDGCPDPDNDADGVIDGEDECPTVAGASRPDTKLHGCPSPDRDGDAIDDDEDRCPDAAEDYDGVDDDDGCADAEGASAPIARVEAGQVGPELVLSRPIRFAGDDIDPTSQPAIRAIAQILNAHPDWILAVGVRPSGPSPDAQQSALNRSLSIAIALRNATYRDGVAEALGWPAVDDTRDAARTGVGFLVLVPREEAPAR